MPAPRSGDDIVRGHAMSLAACAVHWSNIARRFSHPLVVVLTVSHEYSST